MNFHEIICLWSFPLAVRFGNSWKKRQIKRMNSDWLREPVVCSSLIKLVWTGSTTACFSFDHFNTCCWLMMLRMCRWIALNIIAMSFSSMLVVLTKIILKLSFGQIWVEFKSSLYRVRAIFWVGFEVDSDQVTYRTSPVEKPHSSQT